MIIALQVNDIVEQDDLLAEKIRGDWALGTDGVILMPPAFESALAMGAKPCPVLVDSDLSMVNILPGFRGKQMGSACEVGVRKLSCTYNKRSL